MKKIILILGAEIKNAIFWIEDILAKSFVLNL